MAVISVMGALYFVMSLLTIRAGNIRISFASLVETARMYSREVEYSDENIDEILSYF